MNDYYNILIGILALAVILIVAQMYNTISSIS